MTSPIRPMQLAPAFDPSETLSSEPGSFGMALGLLGFGEGRRHVDGLYGSEVWLFDRPECRVICRVADGDRVEVIAWDRSRLTAKLEAFRMEFTGATPIAAVVAALEAIVTAGDLPGGELVRCEAVHDTGRPHRLVPDCTHPHFVGH